MGFNSAFKGLRLLNAFGQIATVWEMMIIIIIKFASDYK